MKSHAYKLTAIFSLLVSVQVFGQADGVSLHLAKYPKTITAFDVSEDGSWLAVGGGSLLFVSNVLDGNPVFQANIPYGTQIESLKISPDKAKLAVLSSDKLSHDRFVTLYDMHRRELFMTTTLVTMFLPPFNRIYELSRSDVDGLIKNKIANFYMPSFSERFKFIGDRLFLFFSNSVAEFYYDGNNKESMLAYLNQKSDFMQPPGFEMVKPDTIPHYYVNLPWFSKFDSVMKRTYHIVVFDPTLTYGFVLYTQNNKLRGEVWNIWNDEKIYEAVDENFTLKGLSETNADLLSLAPDGRSLFFYNVDSTNKNELSIYGSVQRVDLVNKNIEQLFRFPEPEPVFNLKISPDGKYLFCNGADYNKNVFSDLLESGIVKQGYEKQILSNFWSYNLERKQLRKLPVGYLSIPNVVFSSTLNNAFVATAKGFFRANLNEDIVYPMPSPIAPKIVRMETDAKGYLWIGTDGDVRKFDLTNLRQLKYWPMGKIEHVSFNPSHEKVFASDGRSIAVTNLHSGQKEEGSPHKNTIGGLTYHTKSDKIISGEYIDLQPWSDSCQLLFGKVGNQTESLPFSSSYAFEDVDSIVTRKNPVLQRGTPVRQLALSPDGSYLACAVQAKMPIDPMALIKTALNEYLNSSNDSAVMSTAEGSIYLKDPYPGEIKLWKFDNGRWTEYKTLAANKEFTSHNTSVHAFAFSEDNKYFAAADKNLDIHVWDIRTGKKIAECFNEHGDAFTVRQLSWYREDKNLDDFKTDYNISAIIFSPDGRYLISAGNDKKLVIWKRIPAKDSIKLKNQEYVDGEGVTQNRMVNFSDSISYVFDTTVAKGFLVSAITALTFTPDGRFLLIGAEDGTITVFNFFHKIVQGIIQLRNHSDGYVVLGPYNRYYANPQGGNLIYFASEVTSYPSEQFDLYYNRPDFLAAFFGSLFFDTYKNDSSVIARIMYNLKFDSAILNKRLSLYGLNKDVLQHKQSHLEVKLLNEPTLLKNQTIGTDSLDLDILAKGNTAALAAIHVWVNNVPVFGRWGKPIPAGFSIWNQQLSIPLSKGENLIQIACRDAVGMYSLRKSVVVYHQVKNKKPNLFLIALGVDKYKYLLGNKLQYPVKNCRDLIRAYKKGQFAHVYIDSVFNEDLTGKRLDSLKSKLQKSHPDDLVIVFYSGHGKQTPDHNLFLSTTATVGANLSGTALPFSVLDNLLDSIPARQKLLMIDACESGLTDPTTSLDKADLPVFLETLEMFSDLNRGTGTVTIGSTSGYTNAHEWPKLGNSTFSYTLLQALSKPAREKYCHADYNKDDQVTVTELQRYLKQNVPELNRKFTKESLIRIDQQRPSSRTVNLNNDFRVF